MKLMKILSLLYKKVYKKSKIDRKNIFVFLETIFLNSLIFIIFETG